ncbi:ABC transporter substrate-binding protein [Aliirhizobium cellulosilyticum]|uniref:Peptide/nickel transport system substrate-binding protein n=1 Tax=Aliirhizobium cellulosilyticum TaxID=393664 RepID=A0A7W6TGR7_9HYPH|nr:ABC transporter substrate-binding protein [Rhizobium cellulosilyticum]MBB4349980.1 peptide/nickel transport system substrate-binding protein [Rhizobium cellulosilyticum]MBB4413159.1 peptide/nickel transport system substrate-binding protein [Rhizobium cellulosilyticum]MBB4447903.1 peptide/nickel transport system substrate-binding protein [Rhizobium cellulosilyticum]
MPGLRRITSALLLAAALGGATFLSGPASAKDMFVVDLVNEPSSLDPQKQWNPDSYYVYRNVFDNLITRDDAGKIAPQIATSWEYKSPSEVVFKLRSDVKFHDGEKLTAEDVAFSVTRIIDPAFKSPQLSQFNKIKSAAVTGENEVTITTNGPYPVLLAQLVKLSIVPKHVVEKIGDDAFNAAPVGSGPYKFDRWDRGSLVALSRNADYWGDKGPFEKAEFRAVPDAATRLADLQAGNADLIVTLDADQAKQLEGSGSAKVLSALTERIAYLKLNPTIAPLDNPKVRQAVAMAIDKQGIVEGLLGGFDKPASQMANDTYFGFVPNLKNVEFDPEGAKKIVEETGAGKTKLSFATSPVFDQRIVQALAQMLSDVGFNVDIQLTDMAAYLKRAQSEPAQQANFAFGRWSCACQDVDGVLFPLLHSSSSWSSLRDPKIDALLVAARNTLDDKERQQAYDGVAKFVADDVPMVPLYEAAVLYGGAKNLEWQPTANESMFLNRMSWND